MDEQKPSDKNADFTRSIADLLVTDALNRRGIRLNREIPDKQKEQLKRMVESLQTQVNDFLAKEKEAKNDTN
ncbi:hypothetical protein DFP93_11368 [Aneurinibacillus soli]|uniref:Uncharacterized protein n=1 Tax=Aneurinibacillus soli TaxID=1500254 RepID=A0A0U5AU11_9BACL|nr:hypothetical protein [Aneurinibacillus soli]PYE60358.1 hypothetical protein DFP93_11368 [Aneurinibacillus soli]BAU27242.1 hypothetical protein CB4_01411 [Aneurinibacillus soli]